MNWRRDGGSSTRPRRSRKGRPAILIQLGLEVVAELRGPGAIGRPVHPDPGIADLIRRGLVSQIGTNERQAYPLLGRVLRGKTAAQLLDEERGDR